MVVQKMIDLKALPVKLVVCDSVREASGLAMSSRNMRLNETEKIQALNIIKVLQYIQSHIEAGNVVELAQNARILLEKEGFIVDYVAIADAQTLRNIEVWDGKQKIVALVAAYLNEVRLIDNIILR